MLCIQPLKPEGTYAIEPGQPFEVFRVMYTVRKPTDPKAEMQKIEVPALYQVNGYVQGNAWKSKDSDHITYNPWIIATSMQHAGRAKLGFDPVAHVLEAGSNIKAIQANSWEAPSYAVVENEENT